ncbi:MAG: hypothetical protein RL532_1068 [Actinomycetota bacterium]
MVYFITIVAVCTIASGRITALLDFARRHLWISAAHLGAIAFASFWYLAIYNPRVDPRMAEHLGPDVALVEQLAHSFGDITRVLQEAVGDLGSLEVPIPRLATLAILLLSSWIITTGWRDASRSVRLATIALIALCVVAIIAIDLNYYRILRGYGVQGRHLTPLLVGIPLLAARRARFTNGQRYTIGATVSATRLVPYGSSHICWLDTPLCVDTPLVSSATKCLRCSIFRSGSQHWESSEPCSP